MRTATELRQRVISSRLGATPEEILETFGEATLPEFDYDAHVEFGRILRKDYYDNPERVWHGHTPERGYFMALSEAGLVCHHPLPMRRMLTPTAWECLACRVAFAKDFGVSTTEEK
jgi:hypothetical protein